MQCMITASLRGAATRWPRPSVVPLEQRFGDLSPGLQDGSALPYRSPTGSQDANGDLIQREVRTNPAPGRLRS